jgi:hypothetical protein
MTILAPKIDDRTAAKISTRLSELLPELTRRAGTPYPFAAWAEYDAVTGQPTGASAALIGIFSRLTELVIQRLNRAPEKNLRAFLELLGAARLPPEPARVPLTFFLATGRAEKAVVRAGTRVAAPPRAGETAPTVFEVENDLDVTATKLSALVTLDPELDSYADWSEAAEDVGLALPSAVSAAWTALRGRRQLEHILYLGSRQLLGYEQIQALRLEVSSNSVSGPREVAWERWNGSKWVSFAPTSDGTQAWSQPGVIAFAALEPVPEAPVDGRANRWLRCRLTTPITTADASVTVTGELLRPSQLPRVSKLLLSVDLARDPQEGLAPELGFANGVPLDLSKEFFPFGERPKAFDTFYLASSEAFSKARASSTDPGSATVSLAIELAGSAGPSSDLELVWECATPSGWKQVGKSTPSKESSGTDAGFSDGTRAFTRKGTVSFVLPVSVGAVSVNGRESHWLRVRMASGDYGVDAQYRLKLPQRPPEDPENGYILVPASFRPPVIARASLGYTFTDRAPPELCLSYNQLSFRDVSAEAGGAGEFLPFAPASDQLRPALYLGFELPKAGAALRNTMLSLYALTAAAKYGERAAALWPDSSFATGAPGATLTHRFSFVNPLPVDAVFDVTLLARWSSTAPATVFVRAGAAESVTVSVVIPEAAGIGESDGGSLRLAAAADPALEVHSASFVTSANTQLDEPPKLSWEYWSGSGFARVTVQDGSESLVEPGLLRFAAPADFAASSLFGRERYWLRVTLDRGRYESSPRLRRLLLNTTPALQAPTMLDETLGSSNGDKNQRFRSTRSPMLRGQTLEVRELEVPADDERRALERDEGTEVVRRVPALGGRPEEIWVRWHEVADFYASGARDRHYVVDHLSGAIQFGDGVNGRIPPIGASNLRLARYQSGGGAAGNRDAGTVTELKTTVPYVERVTNLEPAQGGSDAETLDALYARIPRSLRHRDRAVTREDYEDLGELASPEVARSHCVPLRDLAIDPLGDQPRPGVTSLIIVPRSSDDRPSPTQELLERVQHHLRDRSAAGAAVRVVGPLYVRVDVRAEVAVESLDGASSVESAVEARLREFLHPLSGGLDGSGWDFGRAPHHSDVLALIEDVSGVDHVRFLEVTEIEDVPLARQTDRFLVYSGKHRVDLAFDEA